MRKILALVLATLTGFATARSNVGLYGECTKTKQCIPGLICMQVDRMIGTRCMGQDWMNVQETQSDDEMLDCIIKDGEFCQSDAACSVKGQVCMLNSHKYPHCLPKKCRGYLDRISKKKNHQHKKDRKNSGDETTVKQDLSKCLVEGKVCVAHTDCPVGEFCLLENILHSTCRPTYCPPTAKSQAFLN